MRLSIVTSFIFLLAGCQLTTPLAPLLDLPEEPKLTSEDIQVQYITTGSSDSAQIKSVQLPAHKITKQQTIAFDLSKANVDYDLTEIFSEAFQKASLQPVNDTSNAEYKLTINKLSHKQGIEAHYELKNKQSINDLEGINTKTLMTKSCNSMDTTISLRLTHTQSGDVVWFAQASLNTAEQPITPLIYQFNLYQEITNKKQVSAFILKNNTEEARALRAQNEITIPAYEISTRSSELLKVSGSCSQNEVDALAPKISLQLIKTLVNKLKISDIRI